jgi:hypothetical protein
MHPGHRPSSTISTTSHCLSPRVRLLPLVATCALVIFRPARPCCHKATGAKLELPRATPVIQQEPAVVMLRPTISMAGQTTLHGAPAEPFALASIIGCSRPTVLRRLTALSVCSPIASIAHIHCRNTRQTAHAVADETFSNAHAGASDALALVTIARCISLKQIVSR